MAFTVGEVPAMVSDAILSSDEDTLKRPIGVLFLPDSVLGSDSSMAPGDELIEPEESAATEVDEEESEGGDSGMEEGGGPDTEETSGTDEEGAGEIGEAEQEGTTESSDEPEGGPEEQSRDVVTSSARKLANIDRLMGMSVFVLFLHW
jgi:hypothetical protein